MLVATNVSHIRERAARNVVLAASRAERLCPLCGAPVVKTVDSTGAHDWECHTVGCGFIELLEPV